MNMSYCMYQNTLQDLRQVFEDMERRYYADDSQPEVDDDSAPLSDAEAWARDVLIDMCRDIVEMFGEEQ
jgi:hypothetical protein